MKWATETTCIVFSGTRSIDVVNIYIVKLFLAWYIGCGKVWQFSQPCKIAAEPKALMVAVIPYVAIGNCVYYFL